MQRRADLHVHSKYSDRPSEWLLRRLGCPESFTEPLEVYRLCRERGMDFVTISDHNSIRGALEIAHLPGTFVSSEVTTYFPEDGCKVHVLVWGLDEETFRDVESLRGSIYELRDYLYDRDLAHAVAHPLFAVNGRLTVRHVEKLLVLFKRFEGINGARDRRASEVFLAVLAGLTPGRIAELAQRHRLEPRDERPWEKLLTAGSDDHGGLYIARAATLTPEAATTAEFLDHLRAGRHSIEGESGSSLKLAHSIYAIAHTYYRHRLGRGAGADELVAELFRRFLDEPPEGGPGRLQRAVRLVVGERRRSNPLDRRLSEGLSTLLELRAATPASTRERRTFEQASRLSQEIAFDALRRFARHARRGRLTAGLSNLASLGPLTLCFAPYLAAFQTQHKDARLMRQVAERFADSPRSAQPGDTPRLWFTDTLGETNGVAATVRSVASLAQRRGVGLQVIATTTATAENSPREFDLRNFRPVGEIDCPEYPGQRIAFPPFLEIIEHCERQRVGEVILATPGPVGLTGLLAAKLLGARATAVYHTDFPRYVRRLTESDTLGELAWSYMRWFYGQADRILVPSRTYLDELVHQGLPRERLALFPHGVDRELFHPGRRQPEFWSARGLAGEVVLYVGRLFEGEGSRHAARRRRRAAVRRPANDARRGGRWAALRRAARDGPGTRPLHRLSGRRGARHRLRQRRCLRLPQRHRHFRPGRARGAGLRAARRGHRSGRAARDRREPGRRHRRARRLADSHDRRARRPTRRSRPPRRGSGSSAGDRARSPYRSDARGALPRRPAAGKRHPLGQRRLERHARGAALLVMSSLRSLLPGNRATGTPATRGGRS